jgi:NAD(P)-dependent dehydrogenase (short-subunit alcohol dehydrogenase family)
MSTAIVTGGSKGLGRALTEALAEAGWTVVIDGRDPAAVVAVADAHPGAVVAVPGDVTDPDHRSTLVREAVDRGGAVDLLVNNAGTLGPSPLPPVAELRPDDLRATFEANVVAPVALLQAALPHLAAGAAVVNVTSDAGVEAYEGWGGYGASKAALEHLSRVLAVERPELRVLVVDPGDMRTEMHQAAFPGEDISDRPEPEASVPGILQLIEQGVPSGRYAAREEVAV